MTNRSTSSSPMRVFCVGAGNSLQMQRVRRVTAASLMSIALLVSLAGANVQRVSAAPMQRPALKMPACAKSYMVVTGDYWIKIASKTGVTTTALYAANSASAATPLFPGTQVCLPDTATVPSTEPPATTTPAAVGSVQLAAFPAQGPC